MGCVKIFFWGGALLVHLGMAGVSCGDSCIYFVVAAVFTYGISTHQSNRLLNGSAFSLLCTQVVAHVCTRLVNGSIGERFDRLANLHDF